VFGSGGVRKGERLNCYPVLERDSVRFHYHMCLDKPDALTLEQYTALICQAWWKSNFGYQEVDVKPCDARWIAYMTKFQTKSEGYADSKSPLGGGSQLALGRVGRSVALNVRHYGEEKR
jgi:hypothetical protein